jgi:hypothetical protein
MAAFGSHVQAARQPQSSRLFHERSQHPSATHVAENKAVQGRLGERMFNVSAAARALEDLATSKRCH